MTDTHPATVTLRHGVSLPRVGLGVFRTPRGRDTREAVSWALHAGYRHVDTAQVYGNEADVGAAIRDARQVGSVFVTTKLWNTKQGYTEAKQGFRESRERLGVGIDLFLLHWPVEGLRLASWRALEELFFEGEVRAIGVSNFLPRHLEELAAVARELPHVNQIEVSPFHQQHATRAWCEAHGVVVEAYSPLTKGRRLDHPVVRAIAARTGCSPAQVLLRWGWQHDLVVLPKSSHPGRIAENLAVHDVQLDAEAMEALDALDEGLATGWDPRDQP